MKNSIADIVNLKIIGKMLIMKVLILPKYVKGVFNLNGEIISVIDLRLMVYMKKKTMHKYIQFDS